MYYLPGIKLGWESTPGINDLFPGIQPYQCGRPQKSDIEGGPLNGSLWLN